MSPGPSRLLTFLLALILYVDLLILPMTCTIKHSHSTSFCCISGGWRRVGMRGPPQGLPKPACRGDRHEPRVVTVPRRLHPGDPGYRGGRGGRTDSLESGSVQPRRPCWLRAAERHPGNVRPTAVNLEFGIMIELRASCAACRWSPQGRVACNPSCFLTPNIHLLVSWSPPCQPLLGD